MTRTYSKMSYGRKSEVPKTVEVAKDYEVDI